MMSSTIGRRRPGALFTTLSPVSCYGSRSDRGSTQTLRIHPRAFLADAVDGTGHPDDDGEKYPAGRRALLPRGTETGVQVGGDCPVHRAPQLAAAADWDPASSRRLPEWRLVS